MSISLRPYQQRAKDVARARIAAGIKRLLIVAPTGAGKTVLFASIVESAVAIGSHVLVLSHRRELVRQPYCKFIRAGLDPTKIGVVLAGVSAAPARAVDIASSDDSALCAALARRRPNALVQVASIDSIRNRAKPAADLVIIDESHRMLSAGYMKLAEEYPNAVFVGLTATPVRSDNKPLGDFFEDMIVVATYRELVREGFLVAPRAFTVPAVELPDLSRVRLKGGDYDAEQLGHACDQTGLVGNIVEHWQRHGNNAPTFCFAVNVDHSRHIAARFVEAGVAAVHVDANTPSADRDAAIGGLRSGTVRVLCNVDVCTEGVDVPVVKTVILARPTKSLRVYLQQVGRGSRPTASGLPFVVLDHAGSVIEHGLPHMIEFLTDVLHAPKSKKSVSAAPAKNCPSCWATIAASARACPECGHEFSTVARGAPEEQEGHLVEVVAPTDEELRASWAKLCGDCVKQGYKPGWVAARWAELYPSIREPEGCAAPTAEECAAHANRRAEVLDEYLGVAIEKGHKIAWAKASFKAREGVWPSMDLFEKTQTAENIRSVLAGFASMVILRAPREPTVRHQAPVVVERVAAGTVAAETVASNEVELIDYAINE